MVTSGYSIFETQEASEIHRENMKCANPLIFDDTEEVRYETEP